MLTEAEKRLHRCCFTGHRPEKLQRSAIDIRCDLESAILKSYHDGLTVFISGMARGVDIEAAEIVLHLKRRGYPIRLICIVPFPGFEINWSETWKNRYENIIVNADIVRFVCPQYCADCFRLRNEWLVNHSARVIAVFNGQSGGTKNTIDYAHKQGIPVIEIMG